MRTTHLDWRKFGHNTLAEMSRSYSLFQFGYRWALKIDRGCPEFKQLKALAENFYGESVNSASRVGALAKDLREHSWCWQDNSSYHHNTLYFKQREDLDRVISYHALTTEGRP